MFYSLALLAMSAIFLMVAFRWFFPNRKTLWTDEGRDTKPFFNANFSVLGKPDAIIKQGSKVIAVEYKSRRAPVFEANKVQAKVAALAARMTYAINHIEVRTERQTIQERLPKSQKALFAAVEPFVAHARDIKAGHSAAPKPEPRKCTTCAFNHACDAWR